ncbi:22kDa glycoprotein [Colletotrichum tofieldiae]|uniref:22kDa glycoprotein (Hypersensitive response-inducing protein) n=1 Tax=Colletotrichum tofieldiae TaxID=708197 RepID=A0A161W2J7_9PEZI|nr:22kDa glycoprotein (hypersensitive response-inducing protein) [Colletotrichum tofieldiae]GKT67153.1 22kDa glycoprotein [Colletotrichum tofieldiae]GKT81118.1 22kDa glycoprotein [Colletotrichum tofieldiae]GKT97376.1 22kDa glycoprotein [Colletotrichum tofieldiae]
MKFATVLSSIVVSAAAAISKRDVAFNVSNFFAQCLPHSTQCLVDFTVVQLDTMETISVECKTVISANTDGTLPDIKEAACTESSHTFDLVRGPAGIILTVSQPVSPNSNRIGSHLLPSSDFVISQEPNAVTESYVGPAGFHLE